MGSSCNGNNHTVQSSIRPTLLWCFSSVVKFLSVQLIPLQYSTYKFQPLWIPQSLTAVSTQQSPRTLLGFPLLHCDLEHAFRRQGVRTIGLILFDFPFSEITVLHYQLCNVLKSLIHIFFSGFPVFMTEGQCLYQLALHGWKCKFWHPILFKKSYFRFYRFFSYMTLLICGYVFFPVIHVTSEYQHLLQ